MRFISFLFILFIPFILSSCVTSSSNSTSIPEPVIDQQTMSPRIQGEFKIIQDCFNDKDFQSVVNLGEAYIEVHPRAILNTTVRYYVARSSFQLYDYSRARIHYSELAENSSHGEYSILAKLAIKEMDELEK